MVHVVLMVRIWILGCLLLSHIGEIAVEATLQVLLHGFRLLDHHAVHLEMLRDLLSWDECEVLLGLLAFFGVLVAHVCRAMILLQIVDICTELLGLVVALSDVELAPLAFFLE